MQQVITLVGNGHLAGSSLALVEQSFNRSSRVICPRQSKAEAWRKWTVDAKEPSYRLPWKCIACCKGQATPILHGIQMSPNEIGCCPVCGMRRAATFTPTCWYWTIGVTQERPPPVRKRFAPRGTWYGQSMWPNLLDSLKTTESQCSFFTHVHLELRLSDGTPATFPDGLLTSGRSSSPLRPSPVTIQESGSTRRGVHKSMDGELVKRLEGCCIRRMCRNHLRRRGFARCKAAIDA